LAFRMRTGREGRRVRLAVAVRRSFVAESGTGEPRKGEAGRVAGSSVHGVVQRPPTGTIPETPGSYQFKDAEGRVIYVGKAANLRQRLSHYFQDPRYLPPRTASMVGCAESVEWIEVRNEVEALMLEYSLIKQHRPR